MAKTYSEFPNSDIVDANIRKALANYPTKSDFSSAMESKQDTLTTSQANAVGSGITSELVDKLKGIENGAQKNPDLSGYAKKEDIPAPPDLSEYAKKSEIPAPPDLSAYAKTHDVIQRYRFVDAEIVEGVVTVEPYTNAKLTSDGTAFSLAVGADAGHVRDCILVVECGDTAPTMTWGQNFHPRTDAETDFACAAGVRNVYWISEYAPNEFVVAGWHEDAGGSAE